MRKGERTREMILAEALALASQVGLEGLSIGSLAGRLGLSKSGLFAHFGSIEELQLATLKRTEDLFEQTVFRPALEQARGLPRLRALFQNWLGWARSPELPGGCLILSAAMEYDDRPGLIRDRVVNALRNARGAVAKAVSIAIDERQLLPDSDPHQLSFEIYALVIAAHFDRHLLSDVRADERAKAAFERLIAAYRTP